MGVLFAAFQGASALLLLAAASSSFQAGPGLIKALAGSGGVVPGWLGRKPPPHAARRGRGLPGGAGAVVVAAGGRDQLLVLFYAVAVFVSFLAGCWRWHGSLAASGGACCWASTRSAGGGGADAGGQPGPRLAAGRAGGGLAIAGGLYALWLHAGRPTGIAEAERLAEAGEEPVREVDGGPA